MKETQEFTGKDVDAALAKASSTLGISKKDMSYDVITAGASGIFGIVGRKDAKIKVTLPTAKTNDDEMEGIRSIVDEAFGEDTRLEGAPAPKEKPKKKTVPKPAPKKPSKPTKAKAAAPKKPAKAATKAADKPTDKPAGKPTDKKEEDNGRWDTKPAERRPQNEKAELPPPVDVTQESMDLGKEALQKMADLITDDAQVEPVADQDRLTLQITGGNAGILIGRKGQTLDAMQFLTDKIINRKSEARVRVKVDIEGYMETRKSNLKHLAYKMAEKAKKTGRPATINQMSAQDRRIVHLALKDDSQVRTQSMGDGYYRRLVIFPKKKNSFRGKRRSKK